MRLYISRSGADDYRFVSNIIKRRNLDPRMQRPKSKRTQTTQRVTITEQYAWGSVIFASGQRTQATMVAIGDDNMLGEKIPECIGMFLETSDPSAHECHGDTSAEAGSYEHKACTWLGPCEKIKRTAYAMDITPEALLNRYKMEDIASGEVLQAYEQQKLAEAAAPPVEPDVDAEALPEPPQAQEAEPPVSGESGEQEDDEMARKNPYAKGDKYDDLRPVAHRFFRAAASAAERTLSKGKESAKHGAFYVIDRTGPSFYMVMFCKTTKGWDKSTCVLRLAPRDEALHLQLPLTVDEIKGVKGATKLLGKYDLEALDDGKMHTIVRGVKADDVQSVAEMVALLCNKGAIELPE